MKGLDLLAAALDAAPDVSIWDWAKVTAVSPLRVQLDGEDAALDVTPDTLVTGLAVNDRVWAQLVTNDNPARRYRRLIVHGRAGGLAAVTPTPGEGVKLAVSGAPAVSSTSASTAAGTLSSVYTGFSNNSMTWKDGHLYKATVNYGISDNINSSFSITDVDLYRGSSVSLIGWRNTMPANGHLTTNQTQVAWLKRSAGSDVTDGVGVAVLRYVSGIAGTSNLDSASVVIEDVGLISEHAGLAAIAIAV